MPEQHAVRNETGNRACGFEIDLVHERRRAVIEIVAAGRDPGMHVQNGFAPSEFFPYGFQVRVAGPMTLVVIGVDTDAVTFQRVIGVGDLL